MNNNVINDIISNANRHAINDSFSNDAGSDVIVLSVSS